MDTYTKDLKEWLNRRFRACDENGVYISHQPIYGFRKSPSEPEHVSRYVITFRLLESLRHIQFESLLDVGGAEGYKAFLAYTLFGIPVVSTDLSEEACKRASEIFGIESEPTDIHNMPYEDDKFDIITCSETLEHVTDWKRATSELLRVAKRAIVISVPHDSKKMVEQNKASKEIHSHIHQFDSHSFDYLKSEGYTVMAQKISSSLLVIPARLVDAQTRVHSENWKHPRIVTQIFNLLTVATKQIFGKRAATFLIWLDYYLSMILPFYQANLFVIVKDKSCLLHDKVKAEIKITDVVNFSVPHHYLVK